MCSQKKLTELYQSKSNQLSSQNEELEQLVTDLEKQMILLKDEADASRGSLQELKAYSEDQEVDLVSLRKQVSSTSIDFPPPAIPSDNGSLSETATAAAMLQKSGKTFTQVYTEYARLQHDLVKERAETAQLKHTLEEIVSEIEQRGPSINQTMDDFERAKLEIDRISTDLLVATKTRNEALEIAKQTKFQFDAISQEKNLFEKDVKDMARQIQALLRQLDSVSPGMVGLQHLDRSVMERLSNKVDEGLGSDEYESPAEALIAERLVVFKNIEELQSQNQALRRSLRSVSYQMEQIQQNHGKEQYDYHAAEMSEASKLIERLSEQLKLSNLNIETLMRERDQWRRVAESRSPTGASPTRSIEQPIASIISKNQNEFEDMFKQTQVIYLYNKSEILIRIGKSAATTQK